MFSFEFEYWSDIFLDHYVVSVLASILAIVTTIVISKKYNMNNPTKETHRTLSGIPADDETPEVLPPNSAALLKKSPALAAESIIKANMTEEQRRLELEVRQKQLSQIYELMQKQSDMFGNVSLEEVEQQFKMYQ